MIGPDEELPSFITADEEKETGDDGWEQGEGWCRCDRKGKVVG